MEVPPSIFKTKRTYTKPQISTKYKKLTLSISTKNKRTINFIFYYNDLRPKNHKSTFKINGYWK